MPAPRLRPSSTEAGRPSRRGRPDGAPRHPGGPVGLRRLPDFRRLANLVLVAGLAGGVVAGGGVARAEGGYARLEGHGGPVRAVAISPDGDHALTGSFDTSAGYWRLADATLVRWLEAHDGGVNAVAFLPDGRRALTGASDDILILWDLGEGRPLARFVGHNAKVVAVAVSPDGSRAASASWDERIGLWELDPAPRDADPGSADAPRTEPMRWLTGHRGIVNDVRFGGGGRTLYSASEDGTVRRWHLDGDAGEAPATSEVLLEHGFGINQLIVDEADGWLAIGAVDGALKVFALADGRPLADLTGDRRPILALALSRDRRWLAVGDGEGYITLVDTQDWSIERDFRAARRGPIWALAWEPGGARLLAGGLAEEAVLWPIGASIEEGLLDALPEAFAASGEMSNGERQFVRRCSICHSLDPDDRRRAGPTLWGVFGRRAGTAPGYRYSEGLRRSTIVWNEETISRLFELGPEVVTPGSKMPLQQIPDARDRRDLISFLKSHTAGPRKADGSPAGTTQGGIR